MIKSLYPIFQRWAQTGSVYILSDPHLGDSDCKFMDKEWITPEQQIEIINNVVHKSDTFVCLGDVGNPDYAKKIKAGHKVLILGNHDKRKDYKDIFDEIYDGALFIADRILLSHEPVVGLDWCLNIHGHDHNNASYNYGDTKHLNLAANVCGYTPVDLGKLIKNGILSDIENIHRKAINKQTEKKMNKPAHEVIFKEEDTEEERYCLTEWGCLLATLTEYNIDISHISGRVGGHIVDDFMELLCKQGYIAKAEDVNTDEDIHKVRLYDHTYGMYYDEFEDAEE